MTKLGRRRRKLERQDELFEELILSPLQEYNEEIGCVMSPKASVNLRRVSSFSGSESHNESFRFDTLDETESEDDELNWERNRLQSSALRQKPEKIELQDSCGTSYSEYTEQSPCLSSSRPRQSFNRVFSFSGIVLPDTSPNQEKKVRKEQKRLQKEGISQDSKDRFRQSSDKTDPFQFFEVEHEPCNLLTIRVLRGRNITKGRLGDFMDVPDPYIVVYISEAPDAKKRTPHIDNDPNPEWNVELKYYLKPMESTRKKIIAEITLMDSNYSVDELIGSVEFDLANVPVDGSIMKTFNFFETSEVDIEFTMEPVYETDLRYSLALCKEEKDFRTIRKKLVCEALKKIVGFGGPRSLRETPTIAILGSGGGFRAMTGYSGAVKALYDSGILDCATYILGLSGSSWYISTLYAHEDFPEKGPGNLNKELRSKIASSPFWLLRPECLMRYSNRLRQKRKLGQPVTFTDFFGMLIGQTLLGKERMEVAKLSDFQDKIKYGAVPMPMFTCLHVRPNMSAMTFHDWVEFTPYEIGIAKYGTFMKTELFGSKFFMGVLAKRFEECPLHFLQGVWGSAFSILFNRLLEKNKADQSGSPGKAGSINEDIREEMNKEISQNISSSKLKPLQEEQSDEEGDDEEEEEDEDEEFHDAEEDARYLKAAEEKGKRGSLISMLWNTTFGTKSEPETSPTSPPKEQNRKNSILDTLVGSVFNSYAIMQTREFRAGKILNYMRGLSLNKSYPLSPFTSINTIAEADEFKHIDEPIECFRKKVHLVDAGLTFNSPYPAVLRPQRAVDLIISFDFSARPKDKSQPFKEILLAEKWARIHHLPFPKIDTSVFEKEGMKECYVFKDENDERAPVILHFVLCNNKFRDYKKPDVPREPDDKDGDFDIFDTPKTPYSTFNFQYSNKAFDSLHDLMEFNTLLHVPTIIEEIKNCVSLRRHSKSRCSITLHDITCSRHLSQKAKTDLVNRIGESGVVSVD